MDGYSHGAWIAVMVNCGEGGVLTGVSWVDSMRRLGHLDLAVVDRYLYTCSLIVLVSFFARR